MTSLYSFLYSFRDTKESSFPEFRSINAQKALEKLLQIKNELSNGKIVINKIN